MQLSQSWVSDTCECFSLLDKNVLSLNPLVLHCFQREAVGGTTVQHLLLHLKMRENFCMVRRCGWKVLWKIYNQDISWYIKRKISITVLAFIWILLIIVLFGNFLIGIAL